MWARNTYWFDFAIFFGFYTLGSICFGRFEDWKPRWRRVLKTVLATAIFFALLQFGGRQVAWGVMGVLVLVVVYLHVVWLPRKGINGWTGEPRDRYLELVEARSLDPEALRSRPGCLTTRRPQSIITRSGRETGISARNATN